MRVTTLGSAMVDTFLEYPCNSRLILQTDEQAQSFQLLQEGVKIELSDMQIFLGGGACNTAASFSKLGYNTSIIASVGQDHAGAYIFSKLQDHDIDTSNIVSCTQQVSGASFIIPCTKGDRIALIYRGANNFLELKYALSALNESEIVYFASLHTELAQNMPTLVKHAHTLAPIIACNPGSSQLTQYVRNVCDALEYITILILNRYEAGLLACALAIQDAPSEYANDNMLPQLLSCPLRYGNYTTSLPSYMRALHTRGIQLAVVTNGAEGVYVSDGTRILFQPSDNTHTVSTLGAGDAFASCFVALWAHNNSLETCTRLAVCNSISVLQYLDTQRGLLTQQELQPCEMSLAPSQIFAL